MDIQPDLEDDLEKAKQLSLKGNLSMAASVFY